MEDSSAGNTARMPGVLSPATTREFYANLPDGRAVDIITLSNDRTQVRFLTLGGIIVSVHTPDRDGHVDDITLGYDTIDDYLRDGNFFGALIGRYANRIANGQFSLDGKTYTLALNHAPNHLHGGPGGFHTALWHAETFMGETGVGAVLTHVTPDGDEGYPGNLRVRVTYTLTRHDELIFDYVATTDAATPVNLTQHSYWNLAGHDRGNILSHELTLNASHYTPVDATLIATGEMASVEGTPFDFREPTAIGAQIDAAGGYDHNFVLDAGSFAARLYEPTCGRVLEIFTTEPGIQVYSGNGLGEHVVGKQWRVYGQYGGIALETQHFPDSPNQPSFPSTILEPGQEFRSQTTYKFSTRAHDRHD